MIRWMILFKLLRAAVSRAHQPNRVIHVKIGGRPIPPEIQRDTFVLFVLWVATVVLAAGALMALEGDKIDMISALSAVGATLDGVGPGLGLVGPAQNFGFLGGASKLLLSFVMLLGRLEMFAVIVLFIPRFWRVE
jgi:trk system potassium uptake protein TrkH